MAVSLSSLYAPTAATVATAVAGAVPTNASITSIVQANAGVTSDNWALVSSVTPTNGSSTVSITGLSGYRKLMMKVEDPTLSATGAVYTTFNADSGNNYALAATIFGSSSISSTLNQINASFIRLNTSITSGGLQQVLLIDNTNTTGVKAFSGFGRYSNPGGTFYLPEIQGQYFASAAISSIQLIASGMTFAGAGTVKVYGVAA